MRTAWCAAANPEIDAMTHRHRTAMLLIGLCAATGLLGCPPNALHSLTLSVSPPGSGFVVATPSQVTYFAGAEVTLLAVANAGWEFSHWEGDGLNASVETTRIALYQDETVTAVFEQDDAEGALAITSALVLPSGMVGEPYDFTFGATGGDPPYLWAAVDDQTLPAGLYFTSGGTLNGTPVVAGSYTFQVEVTDTDDDSDDRFFTLGILPRGARDDLAIISEAVLPDGEESAEYDFAFSATGGTPPYAWALADGAFLPSGLALGADGGLSGTPSSDGTYTFQVGVLDNGGEAADKFFAITVQP